MNVNANLDRVQESITVSKREGKVNTPGFLPPYTVTGSENTVQLGPPNHLITHKITPSE